MAHEQSNKISESEGRGRKGFRSAKAALEKELMRKESDACITASAAASAAAAIAATVTNAGAPAPKKVVGEEDYIIGEVPDKNFSLLCWPPPGRNRTDLT